MTELAAPMLIRTCQIPEIPRRIIDPKASAPAPVPAKPPGAPEATFNGVPYTPINPVAKLVLGPPGLHVFKPVTSTGIAEAQVIDALRVVTNIIAQQCGSTAKLVNGAIWLSVDGKNLYDRFNDPEVSTTERVVEATELTASVLSVLGGIRGLEACEAWGTRVHFVAKFGDSVHKGEFTLSQSEIAELSPAENAGTYVELLKLPEIFIPQK